MEAVGTGEGTEGSSKTKDENAAPEGPRAGAGEEAASLQV